MGESRQDSKSGSGGEKESVTNAGPKETTMQQAEPAGLSPLTRFFANVVNEREYAHNGKDLATNYTATISVKEWKTRRKIFLSEYFTYRLIKDEEGQDDRESNESADYDECSFSSDILDDSFQPQNIAASGTNPGQAQKMDEIQSHADSDEDDEDDEDDDNAHMLGTQPEFSSTKTPKAHRPSLSSQRDTQESSFSQFPENDTDDFPYLNSQEEESSPPLASQEKTQTTMHIGGMLSGRKRKMESISKGDDDDENTRMSAAAPLHSQSSLPNPLSVTEDDKKADSAIDKHNQLSNGKKNRKRHKKRGLMWNGNLEAIPHVDDTHGTCTKLSELDLSTKSMDLGLCRVLRVWGIRNTKRMDTLSFNYSVEGSCSSDVRDPGGVALGKETDYSTNQLMAPYESFENDGPLNTSYKKVFSIEVAQIDDDDIQQHQPTNESVSSIATAAFRDGKNQLDKEISRKRRHSTRRIRVFFYNDYAEAMHAAYKNLWGNPTEKKKKKKKEDKFVSFLMSFQNVPAQCVMPLSISRAGCDPNLQQYIHNPFGDDEFGVLSPYCVCIGGRSLMKMADVKLHFDCHSLVIRLVRAPDELKMDLATGLDSDEAVISSESVESSNGYFLEKDQSELLKRFAILFKKPGELEETTSSQEGANVLNEGGHTDNEANPNGNATTPIEAPNNENANVGEENNGTTESSNDPRSTNASPDAIHRPEGIVPLDDLLPLLLKNNMEKLKDPITVYGVVLGFTPPSLTRMQDWVMSIVLIDDTLPFTNQTDPTDAPGANSRSNELHVPCITLVVFTKNKSKLPIIRSAGDIVCCRKATLQHFNNEPQLCARIRDYKNTSEIIAIRPRNERTPGDDLHNSIHHDDWSISCSCHLQNDEPHSQLHWQLINSLWRWGQRRLSGHPTMSPTCRITIGQVSERVDGFEETISGDLTAVVTSIVSTPVHLRRSDTPRGYIRLWDGSGPPRTDPFLQEMADTVQSTRGDPPESVLIEIEKVLEDKSPTGFLNICDGIKAPLTLCGRVINAIIWEENLWNLIERSKIIHIGSFVRLRNINNKSIFSTKANCFSIHSKSSLTPLPFDAYEVKMLLKDHDDRMKRGVPANPTSGILPKRHPEPNQTKRAEVPILSTETGNVPNIDRKHSKLEECLRTPAPASFYVQFEVCHTIPQCNLSSIDSLKALCFKKKDDSLGFRFAFHVRDSSTEIDILCLGAVAEKILGISGRDITAKSAKCEQALAALQSLKTPGVKIEGSIRSILGKDKKVYFVLKSIEARVV